MKKLTTTILIVLFCAVTNAVMGNNVKPVNFIPLPQEVTYNDGTFLMDNQLVLCTANADKFNIGYLAKHLNRVFDFTVSQSSKTSGTNYIRFVRESSMGDEEYRLVVDNKGITITSKTKAGEFYAIQTLLQMMPAEIYAPLEGPNRMLLKQWTLPQIKISDFPRFVYRGNMLDVSRTFFDKQYILRHIDWLAYHKINKFHIHLADDNGWRVEIKKYPLLTERGAWRGYGEALVPSFNSGKARYGGFYTQDDIREMVAYAAERNIEIIPEIDLPGHSKSVTSTYPEVLCKTSAEFLSVQGEGKNVFCVGNEANYKMLDNIMKEISKLFPSEYIHIGGDEVQMKAWKECPDCQALMQKEGMTDEKQLLGYFVGRMEKILQKYGKKLAGWDEIVEDNELQPDSRVYAWRRMNVALAAIQKGRPTVTQIGEYCYIDMKYSPIERGHNWAGIVSLEKMYSFDPIGSFNLSKEQEKLIIGPQAGLWAEMLIFPPHFSEYQLYPRLCILSEIGWTLQDKRDFKDFENRLTLSHYERLYDMGIAFRLPYPTVTYQNNTIDVEAPAPSLVVRYTMDKSEPTINSPVFSGKIITDTPQNFRFATFFATNKSITVPVPDVEVYMTPEVKVTTSLKANKYTNTTTLEDWDFGTYFRTADAPVKGDWLMFTFTEPVKCQTIKVNTNIPVTQFWGVTDGHVEYSYDGINFIDAGQFDIHNSVTIEHISAEVKAVRILIDGSGEEKAIAIQDLRIQ
ncbi:MAG: family 20 glycosylhydrolase [Bacteroidales bacterium]|nr:family 20 glycosylhydrolase [Bacteroidales bacterium]MDD4670719.1 family 20 glycosylhydrolase [Bacteroidales bacterium]